MHAFAHRGFSFRHLLTDSLVQSYLCSLVKSSLFQPSGWPILLSSAVGILAESSLHCPQFSSPSGEISFLSFCWPFGSPLPTCRAFFLLPSATLQRPSLCGEDPVPEPLPATSAALGILAELCFCCLLQHPSLRGASASAGHFRFSLHSCSAFFRCPLADAISRPLAKLPFPSLCYDLPLKTHRKDL